MSVVPVMGRRVSFFGGGYLRLAPRWLIRWGINRLRQRHQPLIVYVHPREIDPTHPRLPLSPVRRFKSYVNLDTTMGKLQWLCGEYRFQPIGDFVADQLKAGESLPRCAVDDAGYLGLKTSIL